MLTILIHCNWSQIPTWCSSDNERFNLFPDALGNLNGFFQSLANNLHTMESRNLLPNQMRLLGEIDDRPRESGYGQPSAALINSVRYRRFYCFWVVSKYFRYWQIRAYKSPQHIRKLMNYQPGISLKNLKCSPHGHKLNCQNIQISSHLFADSHRGSNFYDPVLARIGLGK